MEKNLIVRAILTLPFLISVGLVRAETFRVETTLFAAEDEEPFGKNLTLFQQNVVYDYALARSPQIAVVFKPGNERVAGRFILLNPEREERTELSTLEVQQLVANVVVWARQQDDPLMRFAAQPKFKMSYDAEQEELTCDSEPMRYRVKTMLAPNHEVANAYRGFADAFAQLDTLLNPGSRPPLPRLEVNRELGQRRLVPREVRLSFAAAKESERKANEVRAVHQVAWRLTRTDRERLETTNEQLVKFRLVDLKTFER
ncbi:MAG: hypothetical protein KDA42_16175 [Planctomycetales bacterium]|nr:hypothetical protein [Planctomycetales bacterium]